MPAEEVLVETLGIEEKLIPLSHCSVPYLVVSKEQISYNVKTL